MWTHYHIITEIMRTEHLKFPFATFTTICNRTFTFGLLTICFLSCNFVFACGPGRGSNEHRDFPDFVKNQRGPDVNEEDIIASGSFIKQITRLSSEFKKDLVRSFDTDIIFKDDEKTGADRYMTRRCKNALEQLARHVIVEWDGRVKLRVIEAWDEDGQHAPRSLHYEGRAIDITTSDRDKKRYGKLASLAFYKANFDWVTFVGTHVHVSCRRGEPEDDRSRCFPADGTVTLKDGTSKRMDQLSIGDKVLSQSESGKLIFSEVIMFMDKQSEINVNNYVSIETDEPFTRITLSRQHLIFVAKNKNSTFLPTFSSKVRSGHFVKVVRQNSTELIQARVRRVGIQVKLGAYAPLTTEGTIVVNNVLASCYALIEEQTIAHAVFSPWRYTYNFIAQYLHRSSKGQQGLHWYAILLKTINRIIGLYPAL